MASDFLRFQQDPSLGNAFSSIVSDIAAAPGKALSNSQKVEEILKAREDRARDTERWIAAKKAADLVDSATPAASAPMSTRDVQFQPQGPVNPADAGDTAQIGDTTVLPSYTTQEQFMDPRALAAAEARRKLAVAGGQATLLKDPSHWPLQAAQAEVAATGMPTDPRERGRLQFGATGRFPTSDETKVPNAQNFTIYRNGIATGESFASLTGGRTKVDGTPVKLGPNDSLVEAQQGSVGKANPIESVPIAQNNFNLLAAAIQAKAARGETVTNAELNNARAMRDAGWQSEIHWDTNKETGQTLPRPFYKIPLPTAGPGAWLIDTLDHVDGRPGYSRSQVGGGGAGAGAVTVPPPTASTTAPTVAPAVAPAVPTAPAGATAAVPASDGSIGKGDPRPVVSDYLKNPVIHSYENAKTGYATFMGNLPLNNQTSDLAMIIGASKILDPPSVVREGEVENVRKTGGGVMDRFIGMLQGLKGEARLPPEVRMTLWNMVHAAMTEHHNNVGPIREQHAVQLADRQVVPDKYLPPMLTLRPPDVSYVSTRSGRTDSAAGDAKAEAATAAAAVPTAAKPPLSAEDKAALDKKLLRTP